ncbi:MAG: hypothetical protein J7K58_02860 [Euryarchaeota archaeon]|nr:hypothetical protein [Euryarchaeota archaeon]
MGSTFKTGLDNPHARNPYHKLSNKIVEIVGKHDRITLENPKKLWSRDSS